MTCRAMLAREQYWCGINWRPVLTADKRDKLNLKFKFDWNMVRSTLPNIFESGTPSRLRGTLNELVYGKVSIFQNGEENDLKSNESRNIHFDLTGDDEFRAIFS